MKRIYFIAICGTGMASLAAMFKNKGYEVWGSDENIYPPMSTYLESQQIPVYQGFDPAHLSVGPPDLVVIGNAMSRGNPEVEYVLNEKIPYTSLPAALKEFFIRGHYSCVVTGTHGKTTTTSMLAWILEHAGKQPSFFIGGIPANFEKGYQLSDSPFFVIEGDEYDSAFFDKGAKFLHYLPDLLIINNIEYDHADIYHSLAEIKIAFQRLIRIVPGKGHIVANADDPVVRELLETAYSHLHFFGQSESAAWRFAHVKFEEGETGFQIFYNQERVCEINIPLFGIHNVRNALAAFVAAVQLGLPVPQIRAGLRSFRGVKRRLTQIAEIENILIFDDFAHHATAVRETIRALRMRYPDRRIWAIFEPRTASAKRKVFEQQFYQAFDDSDCVVIAPLHRPDKVPEAERLSVAHILQKLREKGLQAFPLAAGAEMVHFLSDQAKPGDIFLFMSNGDFSMMPGRLADALNTKRKARGKENG